MLICELIDDTLSIEDFELCDDDAWAASVDWFVMLSLWFAGDVQYVTFVS